MRPHIKSSIYAGFGVGMLVGVVPAVIRWSGIDPAAAPGAAWRVAAVMVATLGAWMYFSCVFEFASRGSGTPAFWDPPRRLIGGPWFCLMRNPMYTGVALMIAAQAVAFGSVWILAWATLVTMFFHGFVVMYEEPHLQRTFGNEYARYCARVPRWIPRVPLVRSIRRSIRCLTSALIWPTLKP